ncbi:MAG: universal stress protein [Syntrophobacterales bacterium]
MAVKLLIGLDKSAGAWRAVEYVAKSYAQTPGVEVTLLHILGGLPPAFWDDGHILSEKERENRQRLIDKPRNSILPYVWGWITNV